MTFKLPTINKSKVFNNNKFCITFNGDMPPSKKNSKQVFSRGGKVIVTTSKTYKQWHEVNLMPIKLSFNNREPIEKCRIMAIFYPGNKRKFDLSNKFESIADMLVDANVLVDDNYECLPEVSLIHKTIDRNNPRVEVFITVI